MAKLADHKVVGAILMAVGILVALSFLNLGGIVTTLAAVAAVVAGLLVLFGKGRGSQALGIALLLVGILILAVPSAYKAFAQVMNLLVGLALVFAGALKFQGRW